MTDLDVPTLVKLTPAAVQLHYQNFCQALAPLATLETFPMLFCFLAEAQYAQSMLITTALGSASFAMWPLIVAQGIERAVADFTNASIAAAAPKNISNIMELMIADPIFARYGTINTKINSVSYLSVGFSQEQAKCLQTAIRLSDVAEGFHLFLMEEEVELAKSRSIINSVKFSKCLLGELDLGPISPVMHRIREVRDFLAKLLTYEEMAIFLAVYLNQTSIDEDALRWLEALDISTGPLVALAAAYTSGSMNDIREVMEYDTKHLDPWELTKGDPEYVQINKSIAKLPKKIDPRYASDDFSRRCILIHKYAGQRRFERERGPIQDKLSKKRSMVTHTDVASRILRSQLAEVKKAHVYLSAGSLYGNVVNGLVDVAQFPHHFLGTDHAKKNEVITDDTAFIADLKKHNEVLIVDNLNIEQSTTSEEKTYMTHSANEGKIYAALKLIENVIGLSYSARQDIRTVPYIMVWRTIIPYFENTAERFDLVLNRLDTYYNIRYCPPMNPHEPQCTLYMIRRKEIMRVVHVVNDRDSNARTDTSKKRKVKNKNKNKNKGEERIKNQVPQSPLDDVGDVPAVLPLGVSDDLYPDGFPDGVNGGEDTPPPPCRDPEPEGGSDPIDEGPVSIDPGRAIRRRPNYIIRAIDIHRFYHGVVYRDIVYHGKYSLPITVMLRDYISALIFSQPLPDVGHYFNVSRFYPLDVKLEAKEEVIKYLALGGHSGSKQKSKKTKKEIKSEFADRLSNFAREFQGGVRAVDPDY